jgi:uncharacterized RDD family membrane protein YckC
MAITRCIRCGNPNQGVKQLCDDCVSQKKAEAEELARRSAERIASSQAPLTGAAAVSPGICPNCGNSVSPGSNFCAWCRTQLRSDVPLSLRQVEYAGFWMRFGAWLIDGLILGALEVAILVAVMDLPAALLLLTLVGPFYVIGFDVTQGATPGKMALGIRIVTDDRDPIGFGHALLRYFAHFASAITLGIGYLMIAFTAEKRGLHDFIAGTMVIKTR